MTEECLNDRVECVRNYLCGYQFCVDMLNLRRYERKRKKIFDDSCECDDLLSGDEVLWRSRMYEIAALVDSMKNGREKLILYYHYIKGESVEHAANMLGISKRTGYRLLNKGLNSISFLFQKKKKTEMDSWE